MDTIIYQEPVKITGIESYCLLWQLPCFTFRKEFNINMSLQEGVDNFRYLTKDLTWTLHADFSEKEKVRACFTSESIPSNCEEFLLLHHREHPDGEHYCLVWKQH